LLAQPPYHHGRRTGAIGVDEGVPDLALARVHIQLVVRGAEVGDPDSFDTVVKAVLPPSANLLLMNRRGSSSARVWKAMKEGESGEWRLMSRATMLMAPRV
jgi:hypothetical protein